MTKFFRRDYGKGIQTRMSLPTAPVDRNLPKGPNFLAIVIGFAVAIVVVILAAWWFVAHRGTKTMPVDTHSTPSQTRLMSPGTVSLSRDA